jgi:tetratricopeptide (TPR) repeat protein
MSSRRTPIVPSATVVAELAQAVRDDPGSLAFSRLGEAYLALGRPREAIEVLTRGLGLAPQDAAARVTLALAHMSLHQWKEAQAELLVVVKTERNHARAFHLLGEVLLRRADYERAKKALAHAQGLAPADADIRDMLSRAKEGRPLNPPAPIPTPAWPEGGFDGEPTVVAEDDIEKTLLELEEGSASELAAPLPPPPLGPRPRPLEAAEPAREEAPTLEKKRTRQVLERNLLETSPEVPSLRRDKTQEIDPDSLTGSDEVEALTREMRRKVLPTREGSGEDYLNELLGAVPMSPSALAEPSPTVGRSSLPIFAALFGVTFLCFAAGGLWVYLHVRARDRAVASRVTEARGLLGAASGEGLASADALLAFAVAQDQRSAVALSLLAEVRAIQLLLYGVGRREEVDLAIAAAGDRLHSATPRASGQRELALARAARTLLGVPDGGDAATRIATAEAALRDSGVGEDGVTSWMLGALRLAVLDRKGARAAFQKADAGGQGPVLARLFLADMALDEGDVDAALSGYQAVLAQARGHALALVGQTLARVEGGKGLDALEGELGQGLPSALGVRPLAWKRLVLGQLYVRRGEVSKAKVELEMAQAALLPEPRFLSYLALARLELGQVAEAESLRRRIRYAGETSEVDPLLAQVDARLLFARGLPEEAVAALGAATGARACLVRGRALLDAGKGAEAQTQLARAVELLPADPVPQAYLALARSSGGTAEGDSSLATLVELARAHALPELRLALAEARLARGQVAEARPELEAALDGHPYAYRAHWLLSDLYGKDGRAEDAEKALRAALLLSPMYVPARSALARILLRQGKGREAHAEIRVVIEAGHAGPAEVLLFAEVLAALGEKEAARQAVEKARQLGAKPEDIGKIAGSI